jgi:hypothetical protein
VRLLHNAHIDRSAAIFELLDNSPFHQPYFLQIECREGGSAKTALEAVPKQCSALQRSL